jgi:hypothetical protein
MTTATFVIGGGEPVGYVISDGPPGYLRACRHTLECPQPRRLDLRPTTDVRLISAAGVRDHPEIGPGFCCHARTEANEAAAAEAARLQAIHAEVFRRPQPGRVPR